jgi:hypothetical protein
MKIEKNSYIPVKFKPQIKNSFQLKNEIRKIKDNSQEENELFLGAKKRLKETVELFKTEAKNRDFTDFSIVKVKIENFFQEEKRIFIKAIETLKDYITQNKSFKKVYAYDLILKYDKFTEKKKKTTQALDTYTERLIEKINEIKNSNIKSLSESKVKVSKQIIHDEIESNKQQYELCIDADISLGTGDSKNALKIYDSILSNRHELKEIKSDYVPLDEQLRQASKLYILLQNIINRLHLDEDARLDLFASSIAAHTRGKFSLSKIEALEMINKQFYYA